MATFNASISFDQRMWREDLQGSKAYAKALVGMGVVTKEESMELVDGLGLIEKEWEAGT